jgi:hypothetical protein
VNRFWKNSSPNVSFKNPSARVIASSWEVRAGSVTGPVNTFPVEDSSATEKTYPDSERITTSEHTKAAPTKDTTKSLFLDLFIGSPLL